MPQMYGSIFLREGEKMVASYEHDDKSYPWRIRIGTGVSILLAVDDLLPLVESITSEMSRKMALESAEREAEAESLMTHPPHEDD